MGVISRTSQWWKLWSGLGLAGGGSAAFALSQAMLAGANRAADSAWFSLGNWALVVASIGILWALFATRCPSCGCRWIWRIARGQPAQNWYSDLIQMQECPRCGDSGGPKE